MYAASARQHSMRQRDWLKSNEAMPATAQADISRSGEKSGCRLAAVLSADMDGKVDIRTAQQLLSRVDGKEEAGATDAARSGITDRCVCNA